MQQMSQSAFETRQNRIAYAIVVTIMVAIIPTAVLFGYFGYTFGLSQLYIPTGTLILTLFLDLYPLALIGRGRRNFAMMLLMTSFILNVLLVTFIVQGLGLIIALSIGLVVVSIVGLAMSPQYTTSGIIVALIFGSLAFMLDTMLGPDRVAVPELEQFIPYIVGGISIPIVIILVREFNRFSLQAKITLGILLTGGVTVSVLIVFGLGRINFVETFLTERYESSFTQRVEAEIVNATNSEAQKVDALLLEVQNDLVGIAEYRTNYERQGNLTNSGVYWNATDEILQLSSGQYGNSSSDKASIYLPNTYQLSEAMLTDMNASIFLDFVAPSFLETHKEVVAVYYISKLGYTVYYPNINLAENIQPDLDPTQLPFFTIANPENNPDKLPQWTLPYEDPAGAGLIITVSVPVYLENRFEGVMSADIKLDEITSSLSQIQSGASGIPFVVNQDGLILAMSDDGYDFFGLQPEVININESPKQTIFDSTIPGAQELSLQILNSESGLSKFDVNGVPTYLSVNILGTTNYKLVYLAPVSNLNRDIIALREEIDAELRSTIQNITLILVILLFGAFLASLVIGQIITRPLKKMTETVEQIAGGNLASRVNIETSDETGLLARAFNSMTDRLTQTLQGLEDRIASRTRELEILSKSNMYRAALFESIARISRIISSTQNMERLLPQITETISSQLGYYHVGIFLVDVNRRFAVLVAANSEGGQIMLSRNHRLRVGETGLVGFVTATGQPRVALNVGQDSVYFNNPDLPDTQSEITLPLRSGSEIIGALDVQSKLTNAFSEEDVNILSVLADQVSIAIQNARSFQRSRDALEQAERTAAQLSEQQWSKFLESEARIGYHFDGVNAQPINAGINVPANNVAIPIVLRGVQIGSLKLSAPDPNRKWDESEIAMAQATAARTALAIETARLLQDAQKRAAKERAIGQISAKIGSLVNIDNIVQTTIQELGQTLPGTEVAIQFTSGQTDQQA